MRKMGSNTNVKKIVLTLGIFDGLHLGHKRIISHVVETARSMRLKSCVISIKYPINYHSDEFEGLILSTNLRKRKIIELGVDEIELLDMEKIRNMTARDFVEDYLLKKYALVEVIIGHDFRYGKGREGDAEMFKEYGRIHGFNVRVIDPITLNGVRISSSFIRHLIKLGDLKSVAKFLGEPLLMEGKIVDMDEGRILLKRPDEKLVTPRFGVYRSFVFIDGRWMEGFARFFKDGGDTLIELSMDGIEKPALNREALLKILESVGCEENGKIIYRGIQGA
ncbi:MAG: hypothetical protein J7L28_03355 [Thermotogae bacterium]|nr:hypothetical protein [Thermotogota bacterium]